MSTIARKFRNFCQTGYRNRVAQQTRWSSGFSSARCLQQTVHAPYRIELPHYVNYEKLFTGNFVQTDRQIQGILQQTLLGLVVRYCSSWHLPWRRRIIGYTDPISLAIKQNRTSQQCSSVRIIRIFQILKNMTFYVFLSRCTRFIEQCFTELCNKTEVVENNGNGELMVEKLFLVPFWYRYVVALSNVVRNYTICQDISSNAISWEEIT